MLTIEDIRNPKRKSGFNHVTAAGGRSPQGGTVRGKPWCAVKRVKPGTGPGSFWKGPRRAAAEEAAQDYCDYINGQKVKMLTIEDIRNPKRKSGFNYVNYDHRSKKNPYRAQVGGSTSDPRYWRAEHWRPTAEAAAQDYCDHINAQRGATPATLPTYNEPTIDMGGTTRHAPVPERVEVKREVYTGPHDLYDVLILTANGDIVCRKVGITARGKLRYADVCKTFGLSIKPLADAVTYPSKAAAEEAERRKIAEVCRDSNWRRVGKESFAPVLSDKEDTLAA